MKIRLAIFVVSFAGTFAERLPLPDGKSVELPSTPTEESKALWEKQRVEHEAALDRLPDFDESRLRHLLKVLSDVSYPIPFESLRDKLGGRDALVWCCSRKTLHQEVVKQTSTFTMAKLPPGAGDYVLVVDYEDYPTDGEPTAVSRARLCYESPFGWRFAAESMDDSLQIGAQEKKPNQALQPTPVLVTPRADARVAPSTGVADL